MKRLASLAVLLVVAAANAAPPSADTLLTSARLKAKREHKNVMVVFHASWCGWCKRFDAMLNDKELKPAFEKSYVVVHLDVMENADKKSLENPGGAELMTTLGGKEAGLPFFAVLGPDGKTLTTSLRVAGDPGSNTGFPSAPEEVAYFMQILSTTAPKIDAATRKKIEGYSKRPIATTKAP